MQRRANSYTKEHDMKPAEKALAAEGLDIASIISKAAKGVERSSKLTPIFLDRDSFAATATSTSSLWLDYIMGGGIPPARIVGISGPEHSGKSLLVTEIMANQCIEQRSSVFYDAEGSTDPLFLKARGINFDTFRGKRNKNGELLPKQKDYFHMYQPRTGDEVLTHMHGIMTAMPENRNPDHAQAIFLLDSVVALVSDSISEDIDANKMAMHAKMYAEMLPIINGMLNKSGCSFVYTNQLRQKPMVSFGSPEYEPCFVGDTRIATNAGLVKIEDCMNQKYKALTRTGEVSEQSEFVYTGRKKTVILNLRNGMRLEVTPCHRVTTTDGDYQAKDCLNRKVVLSTGGCFGNELEDREIGLLLGWAVGDGWLTDFNTIGKKFGVCFGPDDYYAKAEICRILEEKYGICHATRATGDKANVDTIATDKAAVKNDMKKWGWHCGTAKEKQVPEVIFRSTQQVMAAFLGALFSADGSVRSLTDGRDCIELTTTSEVLAQQVQLLLLNFSVMSRIHFQKRNGQVGLPKNDGTGELAEPTDKGDYYRVVIAGESVENYKKCVGFPLSPQKHAKMLQIRWIKALDLTCEVVDIKEGFVDRHVFDVKEPLTNHVQANGIISHNCGDSLKFFSSIRLRLKPSKPKLWDNDHPFLEEGTNPKVYPKAGGVWIEQHLNEAGEVDGEDKYIYTNVSTIKNKVFTPYKTCWIRIHFDENGQTGRGLDKVFDVFSFLAETGFITKATPKDGEKVTDVRGKFETVARSSFDPSSTKMPSRFSYHEFKVWVNANPGISDILREKLIVGGLVYN